jgi:adenylosuccinate synthase
MRGRENTRIVILSGPICAGKSSLAQKLAIRYGARVIKTRELIKLQLPSVKDERTALQRAGEKLDREDGGAWVGNALARSIESEQSVESRAPIVVVDSVRIPGQIGAIRNGFGTAVHHIHLTAEFNELSRRYSSRQGSIDEVATYNAAARNKTEKHVKELADLADIVVNTDRCSEDAVLIRAVALLGFYPRANTPLVDVLIGGQYGSEGKGNIVGHIAPEYDLFVRVGGPNAGHKVYAEPQPEAYFHLPSGTKRAPHAQLLLGAGAVIYPPKLLQEIADARVEADRLSIDPQAMIIEDEDRSAEAESLASISSTSQGVGSASAKKIMGRGKYADSASSDRGSVHRLAKDVPELKPYIREAQEILERAFVKGHRILLEGTQGTSLSLHHGLYPYVTSRDTTVAGCLADSGIAPTRVRRIVMVCRTFPIRVGGPSGPMSLEVTYEALAARSGIAIDELKTTEKTTTTKKQRRLAEFDWEQLRRSTLLNGPTDIALTFVDYLGISNRQSYRFEQLTGETLRFIEEVERVSGVSVSLISTSFNWRNVIDRRSW